MMQLALLSALRCGGATGPPVAPMTTCLDVAGAIACCDWYKVVLVERFDNTELHVNINSRGGNARIPGNWLPRIITIFFKDRYRQLSPVCRIASSIEHFN